MAESVPAGFDLQNKITELSTMLLDKHPRMPTLLHEIHTLLSKQPENVTLLKEEEIAVIVQGLMIQTGTEFAKSAVSGKGASSTKSLTAKIKNLGADAF